MAKTAETPAQDTTKAGDGTKPEGTTVLAGDKKPEGETKAPEGSKVEGTKPKAEGEGTGTKVEDGTQTLPPKAPEKYSLQRPEDELYTDADIARIEALARALDLPNDAAQRVLDMQTADLKSLRASYLTELKADPDLGGGKLSESIDLARRGIKSLLSESPADEQDWFNNMLEMSGGGNHKALVRIFVRVGKMMKEDNVDSGGKSGSKEIKSDAQAFYGID